MFPNPSRFVASRFSADVPTGAVRFETDAQPGGYRFRVKALSPALGEGPSIDQVLEAGIDITSNVAGAVSVNLSDTPTPGQIVSSGSPRVVARPTGTLDAGARYFILYQITADGGTTGLSTGAASAFGFNSLPFSIGRHAVPVEATSGTATGAFLVVDGDLTFAYAALYKAEWVVPTSGSAGDLLDVTATVGGTSHRMSVTLPDAGQIYVSAGIDGDVGTGSIDSPVPPQKAWAMAQPGDSVLMRAGIYAPIEIECEGTPGNPITIGTIPGEQGQAIIQGDLRQHATLGGPGAPETPDNATRDAVRAIGKSHIVINGLRARQVWRDGFRIQGAGVGTVTTDVTVQNCLVDTVGQYGILFAGEAPDSPVDGNDAYRLTNVVCRGCDITQTNVRTDYNSGSGNSLGEGGGVGECLTFANSVQNVLVEDNYIHDSLQYGVDLKNHIADAIVRRNIVVNILRYGFYGDCGEADLRRIEVYDNEISFCRTGMAFARERDLDFDTTVFGLEDIIVRNNVVTDTSRPGFLGQKHPTKDTADLGFIRRFRMQGNTFCRTNTDPSGFYRDASIEWDEFGGSVVTEILLTGNVFWNLGRSIRSNVPVGDGRFVFAGNLNLADGEISGVDPRFVDPYADDFTLQANSPALDIVSGYSAAPFDIDAVGTTRADPADAGAFERT